MKIGIALSGGGIRALIFHLGVLKRLADENLLEDIKHISTVSGGSLCVGLIYKFNNYSWPSSTNYREKVLPKIRNLLTTVNLETYLLFYSLFSNRIFRARGKVLEYCLKNVWGIDINIDDLPKHPTWWINATCFETSVNWRFSQEYVGDYKFGKYYGNTKIRLSKALSASAAFPMLIGPTILKPNWGKKTKIHLWDGGVYDNLGMEALYKPYDGLIAGVDTLLISDGGVKTEWRKRNIYRSFRQLLDIPVSQVRALRSRLFIADIGKEILSGTYFQIGNTINTIFKKAGIINQNEYIENSLSQDSVDLVADFPTRLYKVTNEKFDLMIKHGYEVANATLYSYLKRKFFK